MTDLYKGTVVTLLAAIAGFTFAVMVNTFYMSKEPTVTKGYESIQDMGRIHDDEAGVTCFIAKTDRNDMMACLPNKDIQPAGLDLDGSHRN